VSDGARVSCTRYIKKVFTADTVDCRGPMRIVVFIEEPRVMRS
jgi:hypothetical protein